MKRLLIVNADDFGLCAEITDGILKAHSEGIVTATSIVANGSYFLEGMARLKQTRLDPGVHLTLVGGEKPVSGPVDGLVDENGLFLRGYHKVAARIVSGRFDRLALEKELFSQVRRIADCGVAPTHLDSHQHLHLLPAVRNITYDIAEEFGIKWIRLPSANLVGLQELGVNLLSRSMKSSAKRRNLRFSDRFLGFQERGGMNRDRLEALLRQVPTGLTEMMVHPGRDASGKYDWGYRWEEELAALTSEKTRELIRKRGIELTTFREL